MSYKEIASQLSFRPIEEGAEAPGGQATYSESPSSGRTEPGTLGSSLQGLIWISSLVGNSEGGKMPLFTFLVLCNWGELHSPACGIAWSLQESPEHFCISGHVPPNWQLPALLCEESDGPRAFSLAPCFLPSVAAPPGRWGEDGVFTLVFCDLGQKMLSALPDSCPFA